LNKIAIVVKIVILLIIGGALTAFDAYISPTIANELALLQMTNSADSSMWIYAYSRMQNYLWLIPTVIGFILFIPEISYLIKKISGKANIEEKNNNDKKDEVSVNEEA
jgi:large-conductance mechanosensitive channel